MYTIVYYTHHAHAIGVKRLLFASPLFTSGNNLPSLTKLEQPLYNKKIMSSWQSHYCFALASLLVLAIFSS